MKIVIDIPEEEYNTGQLVHYFGCYNDKLDKVIYDGTPLPKGHGDLVDRDRVIDLLNEQEYNYYTELDKVVDTVYEAPVIIEADKAESEENV